MGVEASLRNIIEQVRRLLACGFACFLPGCADSALRHPLLDCLPDAPLACAPTRTGKPFLTDLLRYERVQAFCDLALSRGRIQILHTLEQGQIRSLALVPVERPAGLLGLLVLADEQEQMFGRGEEQLLASSLAQYARLLEEALWAQAHELWTSVERSEMQGEEPSAFIKNEIVSLVGHELRAPLSVIKGYAGLLQMYGGIGQGQEMAPARQSQYLDAIVEQTRFLEVLVNDLLDISRLQHGKLALRPTSVDVGALCRQITQLGQLRADQLEPGKYQLICKLDPNLSPVWADADRLRQVLLNVVENALKYSPQGGRIDVEVRCARAYGEQGTSTQLYITVRDQGIGIPGPQMVRLFQPFERLERPATSPIPGFGLGLYIARYLIEVMGGTLDIQSCEGHGTDVTIRFETVVEVPSLLA